MSTPKKKPAARKAKPAKKPAARPIPPPPPGWEIVGKDDPRLDCLPCKPLFFDSEWRVSDRFKGESVFQVDRNLFTYALLIVTQSATPQPPATHPPMIRLRLPSEKPTREDGDADGDVMIFFNDGIAARPWNMNMGRNALAWLPGRLPDGILPREPSQEEKWRKEFSEWWTNTGHTDHNGLIADAAWQGFLAAKKGGAE